MIQSYSLFGVSKGETNYLRKNESLSDYKNSSNILLYSSEI